MVYIFLNLRVVITLIVDRIKQEFHHKKKSVILMMNLTKRETDHASQETESSCKSKENGET